MSQGVNTEFVKLFKSWCQEECLDVIPICANGSNRQYVRLKSANYCCIGSYNEDIRENESFFYYSDLFLNQNINVPHIYLVSPDHQYYLQEDLGDETLYSWLQHNNNEDLVKAKIKQVLDDLIRIQLSGSKCDFSKSYPRSCFDRQSIQWDLNYFKYYFLKLVYSPFDEQLLEDDFGRLIDYLLDENCGYFMYRDFQSRNIMLHNGQLYYIDYQGGRRGASQYDVASLLYSAKMNIPQYLRDELLEYYVTHLSEFVPIDTKEYKEKYYGYVLVRILQALGAYGYRGYYEQKSHFLESIPSALRNLKYILNTHPLPIDIPHLKNVLNKLCESSAFDKKRSESSDLVVVVRSFSYKKGIPEDISGNGGGFVFDCRALPNPGRYEQYKMFTGLNQSVKSFMEKHTVVTEFINEVNKIVSMSIDNYIERNFTHLEVNFGCTGGQHRSVYCAEQLVNNLKNKYPQIHFNVIHTEQGNWPKV